MKRKYSNYVNLPFDEFIVKICDDFISPNEYGTWVCNKIIHDSKGKLNGVNQSEEMGDCTIRRSIYYESKVSILHQSGNFGIRNIRPWQNYDYFLLCFVDTSEKKYRTYFYIVPKDVVINSPFLVFTDMNNSKDSNKGNDRVAVATTFNSFEHTRLFGKHSILKGTSYTQLMKYIDKEYSRFTNTIVRNYSTQREKIRKVYFEMDNGNVQINGTSNRDVMVNLVNYIGPDKLYGVIWKSSLSKIESEERNIYVGNGYYFNSKFSIRDLTGMIKNINNKLKLKITIKTKS
jgi:hypothetical protein